MLVSLVTALVMSASVDFPSNSPGDVSKCWPLTTALVMSANVGLPNNSLGDVSK